MRTPFGRLYQQNPEILEWANRIGRTSAALSMKACNFANIDPKLNRKGLKNTSQADRDLWHEFVTNPTAVAIETEAAAERFRRSVPTDSDSSPTGPTEVERVVQVRRVQRFFRAAVLVSYGNRCAITVLAIPTLLNASHIIPWRNSIARRADPTNGLCLNALMDRAFDVGLIGIDNEFRVIVSNNLERAINTAELDCSLQSVAGRRLAFPDRFWPDPEALAYHRQHIFRR